MLKNVDDSDCPGEDCELLRQSLDLVDTNIMMCDRDMNIVFANNKVLNMFRESEEKIAIDYPGFDVDKLIGTSMNRYHKHPHRQKETLDRLNKPLVSNMHFGGEDYIIIATPIVSTGGERLGTIVEWQKPTAEQVWELEEEKRRQQLERILDGLGDLRFGVDRSGIVTEVSRSTADRLGYRQKNLVGSPIDRLLPDGITVRTFRDLAVDGLLQDMRTTLAHADGHTLSVSLFGLFDDSTADSPEPQHVMLLGRCTRSRQVQNQAMNLSNYLAERISDGVAVIDKNGFVLSANRSFCEITGTPTEQLISSRLTAIMPGIDVFGSRLADTPWDLEYAGCRDDNSKYVVAFNVHPLGHDNGNDSHNWLVTIRDITTAKESERRLRDLAYFDTLTGLANRMHFKQQVQRSIKLAQRNEQKFAILFFDLDGFKDVNDSLGHAAGDKLLCLIAKRIRRTVRSSDLVARLGGDEFCVLLEDIHDEEQAAHVAGKCLEEISKTCQIGDRELRPMASIGITLFPDDGESHAALLRTADTAMYDAKRNGKNRYAFYAPEMTLAAQERLKIEQELRAALRNNEFVVYYQPQVMLQSGRVTGVEALVRWNHPERGLLAPDNFISVLERLHLIEDLGVIVLEDACRQIKVWQKTGVGDLLVGVNISGLHFQSGHIIDHVRSAVESFGIDPGLIELEVTESVIQTEDTVRDTCKALKDIGVKLSLDDFGTGFSCLDSMRRLPLDRIKIDRLFVRDLMVESSNASIIATIIAMSRAMAMEVVAEGIEDLQQVQYLNGIGCDTGQGYYFSRPVPAAEIPAIVARTFLPTGRQPRFGAAGRRDT